MTVSVEWPSLKSYWKLDARQCRSKWVLNCLAATFSRTFDRKSGEDLGNATVRQAWLNLKRQVLSLITHWEAFHWVRLQHDRRPQPMLQWLARWPRRSRRTAWQRISFQCRQIQNHEHPCRGQERLDQWPIRRGTDLRQSPLPRSSTCLRANANDGTLQSCNCDRQSTALNISCVHLDFQASLHPSTKIEQWPKEYLVIFNSLICITNTIWWFYCSQGR